MRGLLGYCFGELTCEKARDCVFRVWLHMWLGSLTTCTCSVPPQALYRRSHSQRLLLYERRVRTKYMVTKKQDL